MGSSAGVAESRVRHSQVVRMIRGIGSLIFVRAGRTKDQESACTIDFGMVHDSRCCRYVEVDVMTPRAQMDTRGARSSPLESIVVYISHQLLRLSGPQVPSGSRTYKKQKSSCRNLCEMQNWPLIPRHGCTRGVCTAGLSGGRGSVARLVLRDA